jgi:hypothetical protein
MEKLTDTQIGALVRQLVRSHFDLEEGIERIIWVKKDNTQDVRLIEVNRDTIPAGDFYAFYFAPSQDFPLPIRIGDVTPDEWEKIQRGEISLPPEWSLHQIEVFERSKS